MTKIDRAMLLADLGNYTGRLDTLKRVLGDFTKKIFKNFSHVKKKLTVKKNYSISFFLRQIYNQ